VLATAQTIVIISGGLDISVGSVVGMSTVCIATVVAWTGSTTLSIAAGVAVGIAAGLVNGLIVTVGRVNAVIATLGTMAAFRGVAFIISDGQSIPIFDRDFRVIGDGRFLGVQITIWILLAVVAVFFVAMRYTVAGRNIYAIGGNPVVARLAGLNNRAYQIGVYMLSGATAGLAGMLLAARTGSGQPVSGSDGLELQAITAASSGGGMDDRRVRRERCSCRSRLHRGRLGAKRQEIDISSMGSRTVKPFALAPPGRLCASTGCVTGSKQKKSASAAGE
jgi:L-arabinose transport system permease protein